MTQRFHLDPAAAAIAILGGTGIVSKITGIDRSQVWRWMQPRNKGGTGGLIPAGLKSPAEPLDDLLPLHSWDGACPLAALDFGRDNYVANSVPFAINGSHRRK